MRTTHAIATAILLISGSALLAQNGKAENAGQAAASVANAKSVPKPTLLSSPQEMLVPEFTEALVSIAETNGTAVVPQNSSQQAPGAEIPNRVQEKPSASRNLSPTSESLKLPAFKGGPPSPLGALTFTRDGVRSWNLFENSGSDHVLTTGAFDLRTNTEYGREGNPGYVGTSQYVYQEQVVSAPGDNVQTYWGTITKGEGVGMVMGMQLWSGKSGNIIHTTTATYHITGSDTHVRPPDKRLYVYFYQPLAAYNGQPGPLGTVIANIYNQTTSRLLDSFQISPQQGQYGWLQLSERYDVTVVRPGDVFRIELISQCSHSNSAEPNPNPTLAGSFSGFGYFVEK